MKKMKTLASLVLAIVLAFALTIPAFADEPTGSITVTKPNDEDTTATYKVYEVFSLTRAANATNEKGYAYTASTAIKNLIESSSVNGYFTFGAIAGDADNWTVTPSATYDAEAAKSFAAFLASNVSSLGQPVKTVSVTDTSATVDNLEYGYYFIDSTVGTLCMLSSSTPNVAVTDKNDVPTIDKTVNVEDQDRIGSSVEYTIPIQVKEGAKDYILFDVMSDGLTYNEDLSIGLASSKEGTVTKYEGTDAYTRLDEETHTNGTEIFRIKFNDSFLTEHVDQWIIVTYSATINEKAVEVNGNTATLKYGNGHDISTSTKSEQPNVNLYRFEINKVNGDDNNAPLSGAKFKLFTAATGGEQIYVTENTDINKPYNYIVSNTPTDTLIEVDSNGEATIFGLSGNSIYYLEETEAPQGFNKLKDRQPVTFETANLVDTSAVQVVNNTGAVLPSTGGMGTTLFYTVGGLLVVCSAILFVTKKRMSNMA